MKEAREELRKASTSGSARAANNTGPAHSKGGQSSPNAVAAARRRMTRYHSGKSKNADTKLRGWA
jgi:hypothetical protein